MGLGFLVATAWVDASAEPVAPLPPRSSLDAYTAIQAPLLVPSPMADNALLEESRIIGAAENEFEHLQCDSLNSDQCVDTWIQTFIPSENADTAEPVWTDLTSNRQILEQPEIASELSYFTAYTEPAPGAAKPGDILEGLRSDLHAKANKHSVGLVGTTLEAEFKAFTKYRKEATASWLQLLTWYRIDKLYTNDQWIEKLNEWFDGYTQKYANCGERAKFSAVLAARRKLLTYECSTAKHGWAMVQVDGKWYILEAWPNKDKAKLVIGPVTLVRWKTDKEGYITDDPNGAAISLPGLEDNYKGTMACTVVFDPNFKK